MRHSWERSRGDAGEAGPRQWRGRGLFPPLWSAEARQAISATSRRAVPMTELLGVVARPPGIAGQPLARRQKRDRCVRSPSARRWSIREAAVCLTSVRSPDCSLLALS
ncbi:hypothetical protein E6R60_16340 [Streptomyces sp. A0642]|nr:hypothetical protein E6R60_16340 [Streptomyces sp. A0642]